MVIRGDCIIASDVAQVAKVIVPGTETIDTRSRPGFVTVWSMLRALETFATRMSWLTAG